MSLAQSIGHPYIHYGVGCDGCGKRPIKGYRYKCQRRPDHDLCADCFQRRPPPEQQGFVKIERADNTRPFQIHYIQCDACGVAPIHGRRFHHIRHSDYDLCETCYVDATSASNPNAEHASAFELWEQSTNGSNRKKYHPIYHFEVECDECKVTPICGPRYNSITNSQYDLCLVCFDILRVNGRITVSQFRRIQRPDSSSAVHVYVFSCNHCGATPICGPAYLNQKKESKILCLMCFLNIKKEKQALYTRVEPPRQLSLQISSGSPGTLGRAVSAPGLINHYSPPGSGGQPALQRPNSVGSRAMPPLPSLQQPVAAPFMMRRTMPQMQPHPLQGGFQPALVPQQPPPGLSAGQQMVAAIGSNVGQQVVSSIFGLLAGGNN